jgi:hypothetical protein
VDLDPPWTELQLFRAILGILCMPVNDSAPAASFLVHTNEHPPAGHAQVVPRQWRMRNPREPWPACAN